MSTPGSAAWDRVHPQVRAELEHYLRISDGGVNRIADFAERRAANERLAAAAPPNPLAGDVRIEDVAIEGGPRVRTYRPGVGGDLPAEPFPAVLLIHGGGMVMGSVESEDAPASLIAVRTPAIVVSVDYRLAPEHPYPAGLDDCYAALSWTHDNAARLGIDAARIAVYGPSAGGGLAAGLSLLARDRGGPAICLSMLVYPMLDDRNDTASSHEVLDLGVWDRDTNIEAWQAYLGPSHRPGDDVPAYAAPARAENLRGLPPTYVDVGEVDLFRDEDLEYARRLMLAGVPTELHVYPGGIHATQKFAPTSEIGTRTTGYRLDALARALHP